jgi:hypothetical protein
MNITQWYGVALSGVLALLIFFFILLFLTKLIRIYATFYFLKYFLYPQIHPLLRGNKKITRFDLILITSFIIGNILCITINVKNNLELANRAAVLSIINFIPLFFGGRINSIFSRYGFSYNTYNRVHRYLGRVGIIESIIHASITYRSYRKDFRTSSQIAGLIVSHVE